MDYTVNGNDKTKTLTSSYKITIKKEDLDQEEDKDYYKAINVLKRLEDKETSSYSECKIKGIDKNNLE